MSHPTFIPIRVCSAHKTNKPRGYLHELYDAPMLKAFFKAFPACHAVLSRKLGICLWNREYDNYGDCEEKPDAEILAMLEEQAKTPDLSGITFIYWNHRPLTHSKWVQMLKDAGFDVLECRTLAEIKTILATRSNGAAGPRQATLLD